MSSAAVDVRLPEAAESTARIRERLVRPMPQDGWWGWGLPLLITAIAAVMRLGALTRPPGPRLGPHNTPLFDETYYAHDSWTLLHHGVELNGHQNGPAFVAHPPLGKWMIAVGEALFDHGREAVINGTIYPSSTFSVRFAGAIIGSLSILLIARIARRMFRSTLLGCVAGLLLALDGLEFVQSRVSMLDIFLMFWVLAAFGCLVLDRDWVRRRLAARADQPGSSTGWLGFRPWRWACGISLGAATATKWDGLYWVPLFLFLALVWDASARRAAGAPRPVLQSLKYDAAFSLAPIIFLGFVVYTASWAGWFLSDGAHAYGHDRYVHAGQSWFTHDRAVVGGWLRYQWEMLNFHDHLHSGHPYLSRPWGWLFLMRPVLFYYEAPSHGCGAVSCSQDVLSVGTPAIWWVTVPALLAMLWRWVSRFDWRAGAILLSFLAGYLPWFIADGQHRTMFLFYMLPVVPFMVLAITMTIGMVIGDRRRNELRWTIGTAASGLYLVVVLANFAWLYPVLSGQVITYHQWQERMKPVDWNCTPQQHRDDKQELSGCWI
ncbi:MAG: phospholipid carrier-dependent glycosyltransferase [Frankiales bacterium]|nr:phospholipid carrier-dependent glycosyltransferase [Frankiales bacterium]